MARRVPERPGGRDATVHGYEWLLRSEMFLAGEALLLQFGPVEIRDRGTDTAADGVVSAPEPDCPSYSNFVVGEYGRWRT